MPRLVRLAATFFITATILIFLLKKRAANVRELIESGAADAFTRNEQNMVVLGSVIAGVLILSGFIMLTYAVIKQGRKP